jgi:hypothetical protein
MGAKPAAKPPTANAADAAIMNNLLSGSAMTSAAPCPNCASPVAAGGVICVRCGHNVSTGNVVKTRTGVAKGRGSGGPAFKVPDGILGTFVLFIIASVVCALPGVVVMLEPSALQPRYIAIGVAWLGIYIWAVVQAFRTGDALWGILSLVPVVNVAFLFWVFFINEDRRIKAWYLAPTMGFFVMGVAMAMTGTNPGGSPS